MPRQRSIVVDTVAEMKGAKPWVRSFEDGDIITTRGYSQPGVGSGDYLYHATGRSGITADDVIYHDGPVADDYFELLHDGAIDVTQAGAVGDGVTDDTAAIQAAITSVSTLGGTVSVSSGTFRVTSSITVPSGVRIDGAGKGYTPGSRINVAITDGTAAIVASSVEHIDIRNLFIIGASGSPTNAIGVQLNSCNRYQLHNIHCRQLATGFDLDGFLGFGYRLFADFCTLCGRIQNANGCLFDLIFEGGTEGLLLVDSANSTISGSVEGQTTGSIEIQGSQQITFDGMHCENAQQVDYVLKCGVTGSQCKNLAFKSSSFSAHTGGVTSGNFMATFDSVDGVLMQNCRLFVESNSPGRLLNVTENCTNHNIDSVLNGGFLTEDDNKPYRTDNQFSDPFLDSFEQGFGARSDLAVTVSRESLEVMPKIRTGSEAIRLVPDAGSSNSRSIYDIPDPIRFAGKTITVGAWVYASGYTNGSGAAVRLFLYDDTTLTGTTSYDVIPDRWNFVTLTYTPSAAATRLRVYFQCAAVSAASGSEAMIVDSFYIGFGALTPGKLLTLSPSRLLDRHVALEDGGATPSCSGTDVLILTNTAPQSVTNFTGGVNGQPLEVHVDANTTISDSGGTIDLDSGLGGSFTGGSGGGVISFRRISGVWKQVGEAVNF